MPRKKTTEEYIKECKEKGLDLPIEDYKGVNVKIKHKCKYGHTYNQSPSHHLTGSGCPICKINNVKKSSKKYKIECKEKGLDLPIEDYINNSTKIRHKCKHGHIYKQSPNSHLRGRGCPICNNTKKSHEQYLKECKEKGYDLPIEGYINNSTKIKHKCSKGHVYSQSPIHHLNGSGCPICKGNKKKFSEKYLQECKDKGYDLPIEDYLSSIVKVKHMCSKGHIYKQKPYSHLEGYGCPICNESHGERFIRNYLDRKVIKYESQKKFKDLKDKTYLSYDFYLPKQKILIEYQGIQHYESIDYFGSEESLNKQQYHDKLKREYAKNNGYKLLELHYSLDTQEKVNTYLSRRIKD